MECSLRWIGLQVFKTKGTPLQLLLDDYDIHLLGQIDITHI